MWKGRCTHATISALRSHQVLELREHMLKIQIFVFSCFLQVHRQFSQILNPTLLRPFVVLIAS